MMVASTTHDSVKTEPTTTEVEPQDRNSSSSWSSSPASTPVSPFISVLNGSLPPLPKISPNASTPPPSSTPPNSGPLSALPPALTSLNGVLATLAVKPSTSPMDVTDSEPSSAFPQESESNPAPVSDDSPSALDHNHSNSTPPTSSSSSSNSFTTASRESWIPEGGFTDVDELHLYIAMHTFHITHDAASPPLALGFTTAALDMRETDIKSQCLWWDSDILPAIDKLADSGLRRVIVYLAGPSWDLTPSQVTDADPNPPAAESLSLRSASHPALVPGPSPTPQTPKAPGAHITVLSSTHWNAVLALAYPSLPRTPGTPSTAALPLWGAGRHTFTHMAVPTPSPPLSTLLANTWAGFIGDPTAASQSPLSSSPPVREWINPLVSPGSTSISMTHTAGPITVAGYISAERTLAMAHHPHSEHTIASLAAIGAALQSILNLSPFQYPAVLLTAPTASAMLTSDGAPSVTHSAPTSLRSSPTSNNPQGQSSRKRPADLQLPSSTTSPLSDPDAETPRAAATGHKLARRSIGPDTDIASPSGRTAPSGAASFMQGTTTTTTTHPNGAVLPALGPAVPPIRKTADGVEIPPPLIQAFVPQATSTQIRAAVQAGSCAVIPEVLQRVSFCVSPQPADQYARTIVQHHPFKLKDASVFTDRAAPLAPVPEPVVLRGMDAGPPDGPVMARWLSVAPGTLYLLSSPTPWTEELLRAAEGPASDIHDAEPPPQENYAAVSSLLGPYGFSITEYYARALRFSPYGQVGRLCILTTYNNPYATSYIALIHYYWPLDNMASPLATSTSPASSSGAEIRTPRAKGRGKGKGKGKKIVGIDEGTSLLMSLAQSAITGSGDLPAITPVRASKPSLPAPGSQSGRRKSTKSSPGSDNVSTPGSARRERRKLPNIPPEELLPSPRATSRASMSSQMSGNPLSPTIHNLSVRPSGGPAFPDGTSRVAPPPLIGPAGLGPDASMALIGSIPLEEYIDDIVTTGEQTRVLRMIGPESVERYLSIIKASPPEPPRTGNSWTLGDMYVTTHAGKVHLDDGFDRSGPNKNKSGNPVAMTDEEDNNYRGRRETRAKALIREAMGTLPPALARTFDEVQGAEGEWEKVRVTRLELYSPYDQKVLLHYYLSNGREQLRPLRDYIHLVSRLHNSKLQGSRPGPPTKRVQTTMPTGAAGAAGAGAGTGKKPSPKGTWVGSGAVLIPDPVHVIPSACLTLALGPSRRNPPVPVVVSRKSLTSIQVSTLSAFLAAHALTFETSEADAVASRRQFFRISGVPSLQLPPASGLPEEENLPQAEASHPAVMMTLHEPTDVAGDNSSAMSFVRKYLAMPIMPMHCAEQATCALLKCWWQFHVLNLLPEPTALLGTAGSVQCWIERVPGDEASTAGSVLRLLHHPDSNASGSAARVPTTQAAALGDLPEPQRTAPDNNIRLPPGSPVELGSVIRIRLYNTSSRLLHASVLEFNEIDGCISVVVPPYGVPAGRHAPVVSHAVELCTLAAPSYANSAGGSATVYSPNRSARLHYKVFWTAHPMDWSFLTQSHYLDDVPLTRAYPPQFPDLWACSQTHLVLASLPQSASPSTS